LAKKARKKVSSIKKSHSKKNKSTKKASKVTEKPKDTTDIRNFIFILILIAIIVVVGAMYLMKGGASNTTNEDNQTVDENRVVATVNGKQVYEKEVQQLHQALLQQFPDVSFEAALNQSIYAHVLIQEANNQGIEVTQSEVDENYNTQLKSIFDSIGEEAFKERITQQTGLSFEAFEEEAKNAIRSDLLISRLLEREVYSKIPEISDEKAFEAYNTSLVNVLGETITASHILICHNEADRCEKNTPKEDALALALEVRSKFDGTNFADLAKEYSTGPSAPDGGNLGTFGRDVMVSEFEDAAFLLGVGEISSPVETAFGYHLILVTNKMEAQAFEDMKADIKKQAQLTEGRELQKTYIESLSAVAEIVIN
jgi:parvulin-like peptidyl-prolyl isomerase